MPNYIFVTPVEENEEETEILLSGGCRAKILPSLVAGINECLEKLPEHLRCFMPDKIGALLDKNCPAEMRDQLETRCHIHVNSLLLYSNLIYSLSEYAYREISGAEYIKICLEQHNNFYALALEDIEKLSGEAQCFFNAHNDQNSGLNIKGKKYAVFHIHPRDTLRKMASFNVLHEIVIFNHVFRHGIGDIACNFTILVQKNKIRSDTPAKGTEGKWELLLHDEVADTNISFEDGIRQLLSAE